MNSQKIRFRVYLIQILDQIQLQGFGAGGGHIRIISQYSHAKGYRSPSHFAADTAHT